VKSAFSLLSKLSITSMVLMSLAACARRGEIDETGGIATVRSACPSAAIPAMTGDVTVFNPASSRNAAAIDVVASITNLRSTCSENASDFYSEATFDVLARRSDVSMAREVVLPYFSVIVRGGNAVIAKRVGEVRINFAAGQDRATVSAKAAAYVDRASATLPTEIERRIRQKRKAGDADAALDPLAEPEVRAALQRSSFELLVGFNLSQDQLRYNATR
jgi:acetylornithine deacetylase/succinyl-diaminopimelate desuccinylase-like protein